MRKAALILTAILGLMQTAAGQEAQSCKLPVNLERLAAKAAESVDVSMDSKMLQFAGNFLNTKKPEEAEARKLISGLKSICVRSFEFDESGLYTREDVEALRSQLRAPDWSRVVGVRSKRQGDNVDVYLRMEKEAVTGLAVIAAGPKELTFVHIEGSIDPEQLSKLGGQFGIPQVEVPPESKQPAKGGSR